MASSVRDSCDNCGTSYNRPDTDFSGYCGSCSPKTSKNHRAVADSELTDWEHELLGTADQQQESNHPELPRDRGSDSARRPGM